MNEYMIDLALTGLFTCAGMLALIGVRELFYLLRKDDQ